MEEAIFNSVGERGLYIEEESSGNFAITPSALDFVGYEVYGVGSASAWASAELSRGQQLVFFG